MYSFRFLNSIATNLGSDADEDVSNDVGRFTETYNMQLRSRVSTGSMCRVRCLNFQRAWAEASIHPAWPLAGKGEGGGRVRESGSGIGVDMQALPGYHARA